MKVFRSHLLVCGGTGCHASGSIAMKKALVDELNKRGLAEEIKVVETGCNGFCAMGPIIVVYPEGIIYMSIQTQDVPELVEEHFIKGRPLERLFYKEPGKEDRIPSMQEIPFSPFRTSGFCATAVSSTPKTSRNTSPGTATPAWPRPSPR